MRFAILLAFSILASGGVRADDDVDCRHTMVQPEMNHCAWMDYQKVDVAMNQSYRDALRDLTPDDAGLLRSSQRAWVKFRDAECLYRVGGNQSLGIGASMGPMLYANCMEHLTKARIDQLRVKPTP